jgi:hypothetical protein
MTAQARSVLAPRVPVTGGTGTLERLVVARLLDTEGEMGSQEGV